MLYQRAQMTLIGFGFLLIESCSEATNSRWTSGVKSRFPICSTMAFFLTLDQEIHLLIWPCSPEKLREIRTVLGEAIGVLRVDISNASYEVL